MNFVCATCGKNLELVERIYKKAYEGHETCLSCRTSVEALQKRLRTIEAERDEALNASTAAIERTVELSNRVTELEKALEWYADAENYSYKFYTGDIEDVELETPISLDDGERARQALKGGDGNV